MLDVKDLLVVEMSALKEDKSTTPSPIWTAILSKRITRSFLITTAVIGFSVQVIYVAAQYFKYTTTTHIARGPRDPFQNPFLSVCLRYNDLIDIQRIKREMDVTVVRSQTLKQAHDLESTLTVSQIWSYTTAAEDVMRGCWFRDNRTEIQGLMDKEACYQEYIITKYMKQEHICSTIQSRNGMMIGLKQVTQSSFGANLIFLITLNSSFYSEHFDFVAHDKVYPYASRDYASHSDDYSDNPGRLQFTVSSMKRSYVYLPAPYDTWCVEEHEDDRFICRRDCLMHHLKPLNRVPCTEILTKQYDLKCLGTNDRRNHTIRKISESAYAYCDKRCHRIPCKRSCFVTQHREVRYAASEFNFIRVVTQNDADLTTTFVETMSLIEFFSFVSGCVGFWFGVSVLSFDPSNLLVRKRSARVSHEGERQLTSDKPPPQIPPDSPNNSSGHLVK